ncbi:galactitol-1-phosphate 5-dehydrogenase [Carnobacterium gallinarum]|uniref:galactitol-1-phosphate 5-dehydrogenase n=1 Tax=Carnobacterium gallinarum TaxID=2749 RepID=UPI000556B9EF|nr:galactitol-1-phosphate 5-dehydrogenase [Carnobacterium gallinarum]
MKALVLNGKEDMTLQDVEVPMIEEGTQVLVKVAYCGVCGSDMPRFFEGAVHAFPQILGHEFSGIVTEIGSQVTRSVVGDRVVVAPLTVCGKCSQCMSGNPQMCEDYGFIGSHQAGAFAEYVVVPQENIIKIPDTVSLKEAALIEPFTVGLHAIERFRIKADGRILVLGAGPIGLLTVAALRARGVGEIIIVDLNDYRLEFAKTIGVDKVLNPTKVNLAEWFAKHGFADATFETAGNPVTQVQAIEFTKKKGQVVYVGTSEKDVVFPAKVFEQIFRKELLITGSMMSYSAPFPGYEWTGTLDYLQREMINLAPFITSIYQLEDEARPFYDSRKRDSKEVKVLYEVGGES